MHPTCKRIHFQQEKIAVGRPSMTPPCLAPHSSPRIAALIAASACIGAVRWVITAAGRLFDELSGGGACTSNAFTQMQQIAVLVARSGFDMARTPQGFLRINPSLAERYAGPPARLSIETQLAGCVAGACAGHHRR